MLSLTAISLPASGPSISVSSSRCEAVGCCSIHTSCLKPSLLAMVLRIGAANDSIEGTWPCLSRYMGFWCLGEVSSCVYSQSGSAKHHIIAWDGASKDECREMKFTRSGSCRVHLRCSTLYA